MLCRNCGEKLANEATFCPKCGMRRIVIELERGDEKASLAKGSDQTLIKPIKKNSTGVWIALLIVVAVVLVGYFLSRPSGI